MVAENQPGHIDQIKQTNAFADLATSGLSANTKADVKLIAPNTTAMVVRISHSGG